MSDMFLTPPGDSFCWPMLRISYLTDPENIAKILPPCFEPSDTPKVVLTAYNFPINGWPEHGLVTKVAAKYKGVEGYFALGYAIDKEAEVFVSQERFGQPKYPAEVAYHRMGDEVACKAIHQKYTFMEFEGEVTETLEENGPEHEDHEWWLKYSRKCSYTDDGFDLPPHVVKVDSVFGTALRQKVVGKLKLIESPWDPLAQNLPVVGEVEADLWTPIFVTREVTKDPEGIDAKAFEPWADTIGNSRWPGVSGGPKLY